VSDLASRLERSLPSSAVFDLVWSENARGSLEKRDGNAARIRPLRHWKAAAPEDPKYFDN
jgi:hypothetical protein